MWDPLQRAAPNRLGRRDAIACRRVALDSAPVAARWGAQTGPTSTDRRKPGSKRHILTDANGSPLAVRLTGAKAHDSVVPEPAAASRTQRPASRGYSNHEPQVWVGE